MKTTSLYVLAVAGVCALAACRNEGTPSGCPAADTSAAPIDAPVMAFLSAARALHHEADVHESTGDLEGASAALARLVALPAPAAVEVDEVLADAHARLAELGLRRGDLATGEREVRAGLDHAQGATYFRGHLLEVEGRIEEARASTFADAGRGPEAAQARARAIALLDEAVSVQEQVIQKALGTTDGGTHDVDHGK